MVIADQRIESGDLAGAHGLVVQQGVAEREHRVDRIARGAAIAPGEPQRRGQQGGQSAEIGHRGGALDAAQGVDGQFRLGAQPLTGGLEPFLGRGERAAQVGALDERALDQAALALDLGQHQPL